MTKEELEKEAYKWTEKNISVGISMYNPSIEMYCGKAYKDGAEPREKQIQIDAEQIRALQKQNGELTDKVKELEAQIEKNNKFLEAVNYDLEKVPMLEAQIEKMKNCKNCANYMISGKCPSFFRTGWCKNWEMTK